MIHPGEFGPSNSPLQRTAGSRLLAPAAERARSAARGETREAR
jgi:hypothetical protein